MWRNYNAYYTIFFIDYEEIVKGILLHILGYILGSLSSNKFGSKITVSAELIKLNDKVVYENETGWCHNQEHCESKIIFKN
jgi:hypothetical protein